MDDRGSGLATSRGETHLFGLSALIVVPSLLFVRYNPDPPPVTIPEVLVPIGISVGLGVYAVRTRRQSSRAVPLRSVRYAWTGALLSGAVGAVWMALHLRYGVPIDVLPDTVLTLLSVSVAAGILVGRAHTLETPDGPARRRVVGETSWANRPGPRPVLDATVEVLTEAKGVGEMELDPLYHRMNPDVFDELRSHDGSAWQLVFYADEHEVRVNSQGTVTVYEAGPRRETSSSLSRV